MAKNNTPRISVNKLAEYIVSKGGRQRQILRDQKFPDDYKGMYYKEAIEAIAPCLANGLDDLAPLTRAHRLLEQMPASKVGTQRRINSNLDAIETFESMVELISFHGGTPELGAHAPEKLPIQNVEISVRPDIIIRGTSKTGKRLIGAAKLHFPRTFALTEEAAGYVSAVVQEYCKAKLANDEEVYPPYCFVIDVGSRAVYPGAKATTARLRDVSAECRNIAALWVSIGPDD